MTELPPDLFEDLSEIPPELSETPDDSPWADSILTISRSPSPHVFQSPQEKFRQHQSELLDGNRSRVHLHTGLLLDDDDIYGKGATSSRRSFVDVTASMKPERSSQHLSESYDARCRVRSRQNFASRYEISLRRRALSSSHVDSIAFKGLEKSTQSLSKSSDDRRNAYSHKGSATDDGTLFRKMSISSRKPPSDAILLKAPEKSTQYLSKSYNDGSNVDKSHNNFLANDEKLLQQGSWPPRSPFVDKSQSKRLKQSIQYPSKLVCEDGRSSHFQTASVSDDKDPLRHEPVSSIADATETKEPIKSTINLPEPFDSGESVQLSPYQKIRDYSQYMLPSPISDATKVRLQINHNNILYSKTRPARDLQKEDAEKRVSHFLAQHKDLKPLFEEALRRMNTDRFIDHVQRLLKKYYLDLFRNADTDPDRATSHLLQGTVSRIRIARQIAGRFNSEYDEIRAEIGHHMQEIGSKVSDVDDWLAGNAPRSNAVEPRALNKIPFSDDEFCDNEEDEDMKQGTGLLPSAVEMEKMLIRGRPLQTLSMNLEALLLPATLGSLTRILMTVPNDRIWFSVENNLSFSNRLKMLIENHTEENWNWWPLQPSMRPLKDDETRLHWQCVSTLYLSLAIDIILRVIALRYAPMGRVIDLRR